MMPWERKTKPRGEMVSFTFEGCEITAYKGETLVTALLAAGVTAFSITREGDPRMPLCNMGTCFDCALIVDGQLLVRGCLTDVVDGHCVSRFRAS